MLIIISILRERDCNRDIFGHLLYYHGLNPCIIKFHVYLKTNRKHYSMMLFAFIFIKS